MAENGKVTRGSTQEKFKESFTKRTFVGDSTRLWNSAPDNIKKAKKNGAVKKESKKFFFFLMWTSHSDLP